MTVVVCNFIGHSKRRIKLHDDIRFCWARSNGAVQRAGWPVDWPVGRLAAARVCVCVCAVAEILKLNSKRLHARPELFIIFSSGGGQFRPATTSATAATTTIAAVNLTRLAAAVNAPQARAPDTRHSTLGAPLGHCGSCRRPEKQVERPYGWCLGRFRAHAGLLLSVAAGTARQAAAGRRQTADGRQQTADDESNSTHARTTRQPTDYCRRRRYAGLMLELAGRHTVVAPHSSSL
jgi:hypothetical protein